jgi:hypothetical protein
MSRRALREARLLRGLVVAASGTTLAVGGHLAADGALPRSPALLLLALLGGAACILLSDREWSYARLLVALGSIELLVHLALGLDHGAMAHGGPGTASDGSSNGWLMIAAHAAAAGSTAWLLRSGEATYWRLVEHLSRRRFIRPVPSRVVAPLQIPVPAPPATLDSLLRLSAAVSRRGPPTLVA